VGDRQGTLLNWWELVNPVSKTVRRFKENGNFKNLPRSGRPKAASELEKKMLARMSEADRTKTAPDLQSELNLATNKNISVSTTQRILRDKGLMGRISARKPLLRPANKVKRLQWAKEHVRWTPAQWERVLWTDESKFELFGSKRRVYVRRRIGERMNEKCVTKTPKHGGGSVMVWGCFAGEIVGDLVQIEGNLNKEGYHRILSRHALPSGRRLVGEDFVFQQDNHPKHTSKLCQNYLKKKMEQTILSIMMWPPQCPDLNPIELLWDELDRALRKLRPKNKKELFNAILTAWKSIKRETLKILLHRMPRACKAVIKSRGGYFEESKI